MQKVAVIGAGLSGIATVKELVEKGHDVVCFEKGHDIGGVFSVGGSYDSVYLTVSNYFMAYSDLMPYEESIRFWSRSEYKQYLDRYAEHFDLRKYIKFGYSLKSMNPNEAGGWDVTVTHEDGSEMTVSVERVAVCSGQFQKANIPDVKGLDTFPGTVYHSSTYKNIQEWPELHGKRVLAFGMGESAADVITEVASVASRSVLSLRRYHVFAKRQAEYPIDVYQTRHWHTLPASLKAASVRKLWKRILDETEGDTDNRATHLMAQHMLKASDEPGSVVTKTERIFDAQAHHGLEINIGGVSHIDGNTVTFNSGEQEEFDAIVFCTGFKFDLPFLPTEYRFSNIRDCYLQMFHPKIGKSVAFIGFVRPHQGGIPLMAELQARYYALVCAGERQLPQDLAAKATKDAEFWRKEFYETPNVFGLVNGLRYNEKLADLIGCRPPVPNFFLRPKRFFHYWFNHIWPSQYRLVGPGAREEARQQHLNAPSAMEFSTQVKTLQGTLKMKAKNLLPEPNRVVDKWRPVLPK